MIWVAIATAIAVAVGASGGSLSSAISQWLAEWRKHLKKNVKDEGRLAAANAIVDAEVKHLDAFFVEVGANLDTFYTLHRDYHSTLEDFTPTIEALGAELTKLQYAQVDALAEMRKVLTDAEWTVIQAEIGEKLDKYWERREKADDKAAKKQAKQESKAASK